jgi:hypothetical protein
MEMTENMQNLWSTPIYCLYVFCLDCTGRVAINTFSGFVRDLGRRMMRLGDGCDSFYDVVECSCQQSQPIIWPTSRPREIVLAACWRHLASCWLLLVAVDGSISYNTAPIGSGRHQLFVDDVSHSLSPGTNIRLSFHVNSFRPRSFSLLIKLP